MTGTSISLINPDTGAQFDFCGRWLRNSPASDSDVRAGRARFRGDKVYLRLPPGVQAQLDKGALAYATPADQAAALSRDPGSDGLPAPASEGGVPAPRWNAPRPEWLVYAVAQGFTEASMAKLNRDQIRAQFSAPSSQFIDSEPVVEQLDQDAEAVASRKRR